ncbi:MAG: 4-hydroxyphenylacetate 3-hydroxylase [Dehalococcoidia bacterium]|nr:4-hydroxyphenylacetate 3-hydroxylase [Dehalococcoidia bacterium]
MARTGAQYLEGLKDDREVWLGAERVGDVTSHPALQGAAGSVADLYDLQHEAADVCLVTNPDDGEPMNASHIVPRCAADLQKRHASVERIAQTSLGILGRSPDYLNVTFAGFAGLAHIWAANGNDRGAANLVAFQKEVAARDLCLTHAIIHATVDKKLGDLASGGGEIALHKVEATANGILVRGARVLATLAPFSDEMAVYPSHTFPNSDPRYALAFSIPMDTAGLKLICRDSFSLPSSAFDHPFSSRFDEQDAFVVFDDVEVPRDRIFVDGDHDICANVMNIGWAANVMQQTSLRAAVKLEFAYQLAVKMVEALNAGNPQTYEMLGEIWSYAELTRSAVKSAEEGAYDWGNGTWLCDERPFRALRPMLPKWFARVNEIIKLLGAHNLLTTPTAAQLAEPSLRPFIDKYLQGAAGTSAEERSRIFRTAWDFVGTALGSRVELYERFYLASAPRTFQIAHHVAQKQPGRSRLVDELLARKSE